MIARVRDYTSTHEAREEWHELGIECSHHRSVDRDEFVFVEGADEEVVESLIADVGRGIEAYRGDSESTTRVLLIGSREVFSDLPGDIGPVMKTVVDAIERYHAPTTPEISVGDILNLKRTAVMGVLNVTPDSFSDGGEFLEEEEAVRRAFEMVDEGADVIDIGGESTRPFSEPVSEEEEIERVIPVIEEIAPSVDVPISIDTRKPGVARKAVHAGADIVNDVSGLREVEMIEAVAELGVPAILMHMRGTPETMQVDIHYEEVVGDIMCYLDRRVEEAVERGVREENMVIDPGIGFGKTVENNLEILKRLREFRCLGRPIMVGTSRKSFIVKVLNEELDSRLVGSLATVAVSVMNGANMVRVHDVDESVKVCRMVDSILKG